MEYVDGYTPTSEYLDGSEDPVESGYGEHHESIDGPSRARNAAWPDRLPEDLYFDPVSEVDKRFARDSFF